jgi:hypothetical protein
VLNSLSTAALAGSGVLSLMNKSFSCGHEARKLLSGEARGFKVGGLRGRVREGCITSRWGPGGCAPGKIFKLHMHADEIKSNFQTKINTLTPVFMPLSIGKIFKLQMHAGEF